jgi:molecular chaperone GrpE
LTHKKAQGAPEAPEHGSDPAAEEPAAGAQPAAEGAVATPALEPPPDLGAAEAYHQRARLAEDRLQEVLVAYRKLKLDNEAHRERTARNIERRFDQRRERLLLKFIDILDNLDRALEAAETTYAGEPLIEGLILVRTQLLQTLQEEGLERLPAIGMPFDPSFAEAVETRPVDDPENHHVVVKELMRGYRLNGRVARPARVVLGEYSGPLPAAKATPEEERAPASQPAPVEAPVPAAGAKPAAPTEAAPGAPPSTSDDDAAEAAARDAELTLEEIVARAEAQEALFPDAFEESGGSKDEG